MDKNFTFKFIISILILLAIVAGGTIFTYKKKQEMKIARMEKFLEKQVVPSNNSENVQEKEAPPAAVCKSRYCEGESRIRGWISAENQKGSGNGIIVNIKLEDVSKLPTKNDMVTTGFMVRLIDPTPQVKASLNKATEKTPATIVVRGYAEICEQAPPQVSLKEATVAFKKS